MTTLDPRVARVLKRLHHPLKVVLPACVSTSPIRLICVISRKMLAERGIAVDHSTVHRWAIKFPPVLEKAFRRCKRATVKSWRMDETYVKIRGKWRYLYRAVDKEGNTVYFHLRTRRKKAAAQR
jgi:putative transposase